MHDGRRWLIGQLRQRVGEWRMGVGEYARGDGRTQGHPGEALLFANVFCLIAEMLSFYLVHL